MTQLFTFLNRGGVWSTIYWAQYIDLYVSSNIIPKLKQVVSVQSIFIQDGIEASAVFIQDGIEALTSTCVNQEMSSETWKYFLKVDWLDLNQRVRFFHIFWKNEGDCPL